MQLNDVNLVRNINDLPSSIRLIDEEGESFIINKFNLKSKLDESGLDLLLVNAESDPPVYRVLNYGKFKFEQQKRQRDQHKKSRIQNKPIKEYQFKPMIGAHDISVKMTQISAHLDEGYDVKVGMNLKKNLFVLTVRGTRPLHEVLYNPDFVLNRVLTFLSEKIQPAKLTVSDNQVSVILRKKI